MVIVTDSSFFADYPFAGTAGNVISNIRKVIEFIVSKVPHGKIVPMIVHNAMQKDSVCEPFFEQNEKHYRSENKTCERGSM